jgi:hypothetical protein
LNIVTVELENDATLATARRQGGRRRRCQVSSLTRVMRVEPQGRARGFARETRRARVDASMI